MPLAKRFGENPLLTPRNVPPSREGFAVVSLLNPGAFRFGGKIGLLLRVAERPLQEEGAVSTAFLDPAAEGGIRVLKVRRDDPGLDFSDPRGFRYRGEVYLTTLSHLRLAWSDDGVHFHVAETPTLTGRGALESFGVEDCRVTELEGRFYLSFSAVSPDGVGVGLASTSDWRTFEHHGMILPPHN